MAGACLGLRSGPAAGRGQAIPVCAARWRSRARQAARPGSPSPSARRFPAERPRPPGRVGAGVPQSGRQRSPSGAPEAPGHLQARRGAAASAPRRPRDCTCCRPGRAGAVAAAPQLRVGARDSASGGVHRRAPTRPRAAPPSQPGLRTFPFLFFSKEKKKGKKKE